MAHEEEIAKEHELDRAASAAAAELIAACHALGWGGDFAEDAAINRLLRAAENAGIPTRRTASPKTSSAAIRKKLSRSLIRQIWDRDGWECRHCGTHQDLTIDHITPLASGGTDDMGNLQTLCKSCNSSKGAR